MRAGDCVLVEKIGQGGMGAVYLGMHKNLDIEVAVKVLPFHVADTDSTAVARFRKEARSTVRIDHPNIVRVFDVKEERGVHYLVMEYVDGESADARVKREGPLPERDALEIVIAAGEALAAAHAKGILHRDVKPSNILIRFEDGRVKVADLGLAKALRGQGGSPTEMTGTGQMLGTPAYMSPEQATDASRVDERSDIYSLGATLYSLLCGKPPFEASHLLEMLLKVRERKPRDIRELRPEASEETAAAVGKLIAKSPAERPQTMKDALGLLKECLADSTEVERGLARPEMAGKRKVKIVAEEGTPTPVEPREKTLDDVTPEKLASESRPITIAGRMTLAKKLAFVLGTLGALGVAGGGAGYLYVKKKAQDERHREIAMLLAAAAVEEEGGRLEEAARALEKAAALGDEHARAQAQRARETLADQREAEKLVQEARELITKDRMAQAQTILKKALALEPNSNVARDLLASVEGRLTRSKEAEVASLVTTAVGLWSEDRMREARDKLKEALTVNPEHAEAKEGLRVVEEEIARWDAAEKHRERAFAYLRRGEGRKGISELNLALKLNADDPLTHEELALAYLLSGEYERAAAHASRALALGGRSADILLYRASAYHEMREYDKAIEDALEALALEPDDPKPKEMLAFYYIARGGCECQASRYENAIQDYSRAIKFGPNEAGYYDARGSAYVGARDFKAAIADFTTCLKYDPAFLGAYTRRGSAYCKAGEWDKAIADLSIGIERDPQYKHLSLFFRATCYAKKGKYREAIEDCSVLVELDPKFAPAYKLRGEAYQAIGEKTRGEADFKRAVELAPEFIGAAKKALEDIGKR